LEVKFNYIPCIGSTMHCCQMSKDSKADAGHVDFLIRTKLIGLYLKMGCNDVHFQILSFLEALEEIEEGFCGSTIHELHILKDVKILQAVKSKNGCISFIEFNVIRLLSN
jgi:hypothetical protein